MSTLPEDEHTHPSPAHRAACPVCHPDKTVPELNEAYRQEVRYQQDHARVGCREIGTMSTLTSDENAGFWRRFWHALGFAPCQGEYYCDICGRVLR